MVVYEKYATEVLCPETITYETAMFKAEATAYN